MEDDVWSIWKKKKGKGKRAKEKESNSDMCGAKASVPGFKSARKVSVSVKRSNVKLGQ